MGTSIQVSLKLYKEISEYAELNNLKVEDFLEECMSTGFNVVRFGTCPVVLSKVVESKVEEQKEVVSSSTVQVDAKIEPSVSEEPKPQEEKPVKVVHKATPRKRKLQEAKKTS